MSPLEVLQAHITACRRCPRLVEHCTEIARVKRRAYREQTYWGRPVPGFGDPLARLFILGLAPGAHGANRTGRVFTGDRSGDYLYRSLFRAGFASQETSTSMSDGLVLRDAYISASVRCAPPDNKPSQVEIETCRYYLVRELALLTEVRVVVALGKLAFDNYVTLLRSQGLVGRAAAFTFGHGAEYLPAAGIPALLASYHPSQQNTSTGRLTQDMLDRIFVLARRVIESA